MQDPVSSLHIAAAASQKTKERDYWLKKLSDPPEPGGFPYDRPGENQAGKSREPGSLDALKAEAFRFSSELSARLIKISNGSDARLFVVLTAGLSTLIYKYTHKTDLIVGTSIIKPEEGIPLINRVLALRNRLDSHMTFKELVLQVKEVFGEAVENQDYPYETLLYQLGVPCSGVESPLFEVVILLESLHEKKYLLHTQPAIRPGVRQGYETMKICFIFSRKGDCLEGVVHYDGRLYRVDTIRQIIRHYLHLLVQAVERVEIPLSHIQWLSVAERQQLLTDFNNTDSPYREHETLPQLFARQVEQTPDRTALVGAGAGTALPAAGSVPRERYVHLTYRKLYETSRQLASRLRKKGLRPDSIAALMTDPSLEMIIAILGVWEAGAAYLPLDPDNPEARSEFILRDSHVKLLLTTRREMEKRSRPCEKIDSCHLLLVDCQPGQSYGQLMPPAARNPFVKGFLDLPKLFMECKGGDAASLAYVIYTSGTTGRPKGVMTEHRNVSAYLHAFYGEFNLGERDTVIQLASYTFDLFVEELFPVLLRGGKFILASVFDRLDVKVLVRLIVRHGVSLVDCTPLQLEELNRVAAADPGHNPFKTVHTFISGGDILRKEYVDNLLKTAKVYNTYGPTETTVCATYHRYNPSGDSLREIPLGKPIRNYQIHILDRNRQILPCGITGELCIGGKGIARGYLNNPELTSKKFITTQEIHELTRPINQTLLWGSRGRFSRKEPPGRRGQRLYRSGDLGRWLPDGSIVFSGRLDSQVKLRGIRIEVGEIESRLLAHPGIRGAVVQVLSGAAASGDKDLGAYITADREIPAAELRDYLAKCLPGHMIPSYFVFLERIPLTSNGKVDRRALPLPEVKAGAVYTAPRNDIEKKLAALWIEVLARDARQVSPLERSLGIDDNFFELGGHSLKAAALISRVNSEFKVDIPLVELFKTPSIRKLAEYIQEAERKNLTASAVGNRDLNLVLLRENPGAAGNLFFLHDGSGEVEGYIELCVHLGAGYNYWGIRAHRPDNYTPRNVSIEGIAAAYLEKITALQPGGPYRLAGWSLGGLVAFEIALQLERRGESLAFLGLIDAPPPPGKYRRAGGEFNRESELQWLKKSLPEERIEEKLGGVSQIDEIWPVIVTHLEENNFKIERIRRSKLGPLVQLIPNYDRLTVRELISSLNIYRTLTRAQGFYIPSAQIRTPLIYFKAGESSPVYRDRWQKHCTKPIVTFEIPGDHFSILKTPGVQPMTKVLEEILREESLRE